MYLNDLKQDLENHLKQSELVAQPLITNQGIPINIRGQIDRIDTYTKGDHSYVNIIDYKSSESSATLDLTKVYYGLQMQMMTYMDIVLQNKERLGLTDIVKPGVYFISMSMNRVLNLKVGQI